MEKLTLKQQIKKICSELHFDLSKKSGQCFLIDKNIIDFIVEISNLNKEKDIVLEIGPGFGFLTDKLIENSKEVIIIEYDEIIVDYLMNRYQSINNIQIINHDAIKLDFPYFDKLISNIPYNISGPLIKKLILLETKPKKIILMLQYEFIEKLMSEPKPKDFGRLSVLGDLFFDIKLLKKLNSNIFYPKPKVQSGIVEMKYKDSIPNFMNNINNRKLFLDFLSGIYPFKNKTISNALKQFSKNIMRKNVIFENITSNIQDTIIKNIKIYLEKNVSTDRLWQLDSSKILKIFSEIFPI